MIQPCRPDHPAGDIAALVLGSVRGRRRPAFSGEALVETQRRQKVENESIRIGAHAVLLVVDMQPDFMPGGALPVEGGDRLVEPIRQLMLSDRFGHCAATQDWHPPGHISFASSHPGRKPYEVIQLYGREQVLWPDHCVQGTEKARLHPGLPFEKARVIVRKGTESLVDSYSTFRNNWDRHGRRPRTGLAGFLKELEVRDVYLCGLARDYCVKWSAEDAAADGFRVHVIWDLTEPVDPASNDAVRSGLQDRGVNIITMDQLVQ
jgi:nicotinamidase/pyrazinamidase